MAEESIDSGMNEPLMEAGDDAGNEDHHVDTLETNVVTSSDEETDESPTTNAERQGTTSSARFNILSTMVGGGSLSLPMAFQQTGNGLLAPLMLVLVAAITEFCFRLLVKSARTLSPVSANDRTPGQDSFESIASAAFGPKALLFSKGLVTAMCFFGIVGYCVLLRDMLMPLSEALFRSNNHDVPFPSGPTLHNNLTMLSVVLVVTPLCTLQTLTSLRRFGAASMCSILILGACIVYRSLQCNWGDASWSDSFQLYPDSWRDVLDAFPLFISCYVCHYNILTVHNELRRPSSKRVSWWLSSTTWTATAFYMGIGLAGSAYGHCTESGRVQGNVLLDFADDDPLLLVGRMCLALTIALAFPMLTIPARDILIRSMPSLSSRVAPEEGTDSEDVILSSPAPVEPNAAEALREPLLENGLENGLDRLDDTVEEHDADDSTQQQERVKSPSILLRLLVAICVFWSGAAVASCVSSIDVVWDLLGSSLSILLSQLIPCASFLAIMRQYRSTNTPSWTQGLSIAVAWILLLVFTPLMFLSTGNAIVNTFFESDDEEL